MARSPMSARNIGGGRIQDMLNFRLVVNSNENNRVRWGTLQTRKDTYTRDKTT